MFSNLSALPENSKGRLYDEINDHRSLYEEIETEFIIQQPLEN